MRRYSIIIIIFIFFVTITTCVSTIPEQSTITVRLKEVDTDNMGSKDPNVSTFPDSAVDNEELIVIPTTENKTVPPSELVASFLDKQQTDNVYSSIMAFINTLTTEELIGQLLMTALIDENGNWITTLADSTAKWLKSMHVGNVIFYKPNITSGEQTVALINALQANSKIPMIVAVDHEGGIINRFAELPSTLITTLPSPAELGRSGNTLFIRNLAKFTARELYSIGFTMNLAPVADTLHPEKEGIIGSRSFGSNPEQVAEIIRGYVIGSQSEHVSAVLKHFPGHGGTVEDSHKVLPVIEDTYESIEYSLLPFQQGIKAGADAIMIAHINYPNIGSKNIPASTDPKIIRDLLRNTMGFEGLVITDSLVMRGALEKLNYKDVVLKSIEAGVDILLRPKNIRQTIDFIKQAIADGRITEKRITESVYRILKVKIKENLLTIVNGKLQPAWQAKSLNYDAVLATQALIRGQAENPNNKDLELQNAPTAFEKISE